jgi:hypothetical protein
MISVVHLQEILARGLVGHGIAGGEDRFRAWTEEFLEPCHVRLAAGFDQGRDRFIGGCERSMVRFLGASREARRQHGRQRKGNRRGKRCSSVPL